MTSDRSFINGITIHEPPRDRFSADFRPGDIFACWGVDWVSRLISAETSSLFGPTGLRWAPSHVAIASERWYPNNNSGPYWFESTTLSHRACLEAGRPVRGVQCHQIRSRVCDYVLKGGLVHVYRLTDFDELTPDEVNHLRGMLGQLVGDESDGDKPPVTYDTVGALISGTRVVRRFSVWRNQLDALFCSEMLAAVLQRLNRMCRRNPAHFTPGRLLRALVGQGTYRLHREFGPCSVDACEFA